ncbi:ANTAR domain-containing protein [Rhodococcus globerulus]|uniref:ANTAR domain-containing protein n=1 Tax=Rhodococcus globerulus TaxID=33008 RepID=UPI0030186513
MKSRGRVLSWTSVKVELISETGSPHGMRSFVYRRAGGQVGMIGHGYSDAGVRAGHCGAHDEVASLTTTLGDRAHVAQAVRTICTRGGVSSSRGSIEQAQDMFTLVDGLAADRAFDFLVWHSQKSSVNVRDVADQVLF